MIVSGEIFGPDCWSEVGRSEVKTGKNWGGDVPVLALSRGIGKGIIEKQELKVPIAVKDTMQVWKGIIRRRFELTKMTGWY